MGVVDPERFNTCPLGAFSLLVNKMISELTRPTRVCGLLREAVYFPEVGAQMMAQSLAGMFTSPVMFIWPNCATSTVLGNRLVSPSDTHPWEFFGRNGVVLV